MVEVVWVHAPVAPTEECVRLGKVGAGQCNVRPYGCGVGVALMWVHAPVAPMEECVRLLEVGALHWCSIPG